MLRRLLILSALILSPAIVSAGGMPNSNSESESSVSNISNSTNSYKNIYKLSKLK